MADIQIDSWEGLYGSRWKEIDPGAIAHPAKFNRKLIERIYKHAIEEGWIGPGSVICDPFGGVALGAWPALRYGMNWIGVELEPKFCILGNSNLDLWNYRYAGKLPGWGTAKLLRGDSRHLVDVLARACRGEATAKAVASPPFGQSLKGGGIVAAMRGEGNYNLTMAKPSNAYTPEAQGVEPGNLSAMPTGELDAAIASPPYANARAHPNVNPREGERGKGILVREGLSRYYGDSEEQLGSMPEGDIDLALASPPFLQTSGGAGVKPGVAPGSILADPRMLARHSAGNPTAKGYGDDPASLSNKPIGDIEDALGASGLDTTLVVSSPPFAGTVAKDPDNFTPYTGRGHHSYAAETAARRKTGYGDTPGQLGALPVGEADTAISSPPYNKPMSQSHNGKRGGKRGTTPSEAGAFAKYGSEPGQLEGMANGDVDGAIASPPFAGSLASRNKTMTLASAIKIQGRGYQNRGESVSDEQLARDAQTLMDRSNQSYGAAEGQLGAAPPDTFWMAARDIVAQTYAVLRPGGHSIWVCKNYVKGGKIVPFTDQWRRLCESVGFVYLHEHRAMVVEDNGTQKALHGEDKRHRSEHKSFFRRDAERKGAPRIDYESVLCFVKE